jgi:hypothetical protein
MSQDAGSAGGIHARNEMQPVEFRLNGIPLPTGLSYVCGRIVWLLRPRTPAGQPDVDRLNPDPALRKRPLCGLTIHLGTAA